MSDSSLRSLSAVVLRAMGPAAAKAIPGLVMAFDDPSRSVRAVAADALANLEPATKPVVVTLSQHLLGANEPVVFVLRNVAHGAGEYRSHRRRCLARPGAGVEDAPGELRSPGGDPQDQGRAGAGLVLSHIRSPGPQGRRPAFPPGSDVRSSQLLTKGIRKVAVARLPRG